MTRSCLFARRDILSRCLCSRAPKPFSSSGIKLSPWRPCITTPAVHLGQEAVNARLTLHIPAGRWILWTSGPSWGPAVLFWSYLAALLLIALALGRIAITRVTTWQWMLLALGLTQVPVGFALVVVGWLIVLGFRERMSMPDHWLAFDAIQIGLVVWTLAALVCLFAAVKAGLVGEPQMQIMGNGSTHLALHWTEDRVNGLMPRASVIHLSVWIYRGLMLIWALWLALTLIRWLKWGWRSFSSGYLWKNGRGERKTGARQRVRRRSSDL